MSLNVDEKSMEDAIMSCRDDFFKFWNVKRFTTEAKITEENLQGIARLQLSGNLSPWLTTQQIWEELAEKAVHDRAKNGRQYTKIKRV